MYHIIVNTHARNGNAASIWQEVKDILKREGVLYKAYLTKEQGHATTLVRTLTKDLKEKISLIILGGDGTINEVINGIEDFRKVSLGVIPTGSGNDFARGLGITASVEQAVLDILAAKEGTMLDLGQVCWEAGQKKRLFAISSGIGLDALVCKKTNTSRIKKVLNAVHLGKLTYVILTLQSLITMKTFDINAAFASGIEQTFQKAIFSAGMNLRAEGGGVPMVPSAKPDDGRLSFCLVAQIPGALILGCFLLLVLGKHERLKYYHCFHENSCHLHTNMPVVLHADGEYLADVTEVWFECLPARLELLNTISV